MRKVLIILFAVFQLSVYGQQLTFKNYSVNDGLVANFVRSIYQDSKGFLWIVTWEGLSRYDGHRFVNFNRETGLSHDIVNDLIEIPGGKIMISLNDGTINIIGNKSVHKKQMPRKVINKFLAWPAHRILASTDTSGIHFLQQENFTRAEQEHSTYTRMVPFNDTLLAVCSPQIPLRLLNSSFNKVAETHSTIQGNECIYRDSKNRFWIATYEGLKMVSLSASSKPTMIFTPASAVLKNPLVDKLMITAMLEDHRGNMWIGTYNGLLKIRPDGNSQLYTAKDGLPSNAIFHLFMDREHNIWAGSSLGLTKITTKSDIEVYTTAQGLAGYDVKNIFAEEGKLTVVSRPLMQGFDINSGTFSDPGDEHPFYKRKSNTKLLTLLHGNSLHDYDAVSLSLVEKLMQETSCFQVTKWKDDIAIAAIDGLFIISVKEKTTRQILSQRTECVLFDATGSLWAGTWDKGLYKFSRKEKLDTTPEPFTHLLRAPEIRSLYEDREGNIWAGTRYHGVARLSNHPGKWTTAIYSRKDGLMSDWIRAISQDTKGNIWLGSLLGLDKLIKKQDDFTIYNFSKENNFFSSVNMLTFDKSGKLWCGALEGLIGIGDPGNADTIPAQVHLTSISIGGKEEDELHGKVVLPYNSNHAYFEFTAPSFFNESNIYYSYRLLGGNDTSWSKPSTSHSIAYANLRPGKYTFHVRTVSWNGVHSDPAFYQFTIRPPFWQTWWFISSMVILLAFMLYGLYRYRISKLIQVQQVRNRLATDLHDDIGSTLTNISILSELSKKHLNDQQQAASYLDRITQEVNASGQALDEIIWSVNTSNDTLEDMLARLRRYVSELFDAGDIEYELDLGDAVPMRKLDMEQRRDIYLVFKEALNNIIKHAGARKVTVKAGMVKDRFGLLIEDDGKGFDISKHTTRNGLNNMKRRVEKWNGEIEIQSGEGKGTSVKVSIPV